MTDQLLNFQVHEGGPSPRPLLIAHGLFGSARNWSVIGKRLSDERTVVAVDMRNHGESFRDPDHSYDAMARDLARVIDKFGGKADVLGHSMGGKAAMVLALRHPELIGKLVVADIAPVTYTHSQMPFIEAMADVDLSEVTRRSDADKQLQAAVPDPALRAFLLQSLVLDEGGARWRLNLPVLADQMPRIMGFPDLDATYRQAAVFLRGGESDYVSAGREPAVRALFPHAEFRTMPGVGHWLHAENPRGFEAELRGILA